MKQSSICACSNASVEDHNVVHAIEGVLMGVDRLKEAERFRSEAIELEPDSSGRD